MIANRVLLSYHYARTDDLDQLVAGLDPRPELFADSGAFSAKTQGAHIDLDDYIRWLQRWGHLFDAYANLDVIGDAAASWDNQRRMEDAGLRPLPVFHTTEPWSWLHRYLDAGYRYVALGGMVGKYGPLVVRRWAIRCFREAANTNVRFHGFGLTDWVTMSTLPWHSADSTSWQAGHRYGALLIFADGRLFQTRRHLLGRYMDDLHRMGISYTDAVAATRLGTGQWMLSERIGLAALDAAERACRQRHGSDFHLYAAAVSLERVTMLRMAA